MHPEHQPRTSTARRASALVAAFCLSLPGALPDAFAAEAEDTNIEEIIVTGSLIRGASEDAPLPVTRLDRDELAQQGAPTLLELVRDLHFSQGADGETDQFQAAAEADRATVNIRGLGPSRSLVLVNGQRIAWSPLAIGAQAQLLVDINTLPAIALERIEFLRDGASATYGSDAIAGVMNFITRSGFEGFELSANHKFIDASDGDSEVGAIFGRSLYGGRAHAVTSFGYAQRSKLTLAERDWAVRPYVDNPRGGWSTVGRPAVFVPWNRFDLTPGGFPGLLLAGIVDPNCEALGGARTTTLPQNPGGGFCRFQYTPFDNLAEDAERWQWFSELSWEISETTRLRGDLLIADSTVPRWNTSPSYPPNRLVDRSRSIRANNPALVDMAGKYPTLYGDYAHCDAEYCRWSGDGGAQDAAGVPAAWQEVGWYYGRAYGQDGPPRGYRRKSELLRYSLALEGAWNAFGWQLSAAWSNANRVSLAGDTMTYRDARARQGLGGLECEQRVPNEYDADGNLAFSLATVMAHAGQGPCRYWFPFSNAMHGVHPQVSGGARSNPDFNPALDNRALHDYMITPLGSAGETSLLTLDGLLTGALGLQLAGGAAEFALGAQMRRETYRVHASPGAFNDGLRYPCVAGPEIRDCARGRTGLFGFLPPDFPIDAERDIHSLFGELSLPLRDTIEARLALRYESYGSGGNASLDPKLALRWQITQSLAARASIGTAFRGPTLNQTVVGYSANSLQYVAATGAFKRIDTRGNPGLEPEEATTFNIGLLVDRDGLSATLDYWSYDFAKPLVTEPFEDVLRLACPGGATDPCDAGSAYFERLTFGGNPIATDVEIIEVDIVNGPDMQTTGVDFAASYALEMGFGELAAGISGTRILRYDIDAWALGDARDALGRLNYGTSLARTLIEWKARPFLNYRVNNLNLRYVANYVSAYDHLDPAGELLEIESLTTHELHARYDAPGGLMLSASVVNLGDEDPPFVTRDMNYDAFAHNPFGRMVKVGVGYRLGE